MNQISINNQYQKTLKIFIKKDLIAKILTLAIFFSLLSYLGLFLFNNSLAPVDDSFIWRYLYRENSFPFFIWINRFYPLSGQEYVLLAQFFEMTPNAFYYFNGLEFLLLIFFMYKNIKSQTCHYSESLKRLLVFIFLPGLAMAYLRLFVPERTVVFLFSIIFFIYKNFLEKQNFLNFILLVIFSNIIMYYKEPSFAAIFTIGVFGVLNGLEDNNKRKFALHLIFIISSFVFLWNYYRFTYGHESFTGLSYGVDQEISFQKVIKNLMNFTFSDALIIYIFLPFMIKKTFLIFQQIKNKKFNFSLQDKMLFAGLAYTLIIFVLGPYQEYYLLPVYALVLPSLPLVFYKGKSIIIKGAFILLILGQMMMGIDKAYFWNTMPTSFTMCMDKIASMIKKEEKTFLYFLGVNSHYSNEILHSSKEYLEMMKDRKIIILSSQEQIIKEVESYHKANIFVVDTPYNFTQEVNRKELILNRSLRVHLKSSEISPTGFHPKNLVKWIFLKISRYKGHKNNQIKNQAIFSSPHFDLYEWEF